MTFPQTRLARDVLKLSGPDTLTLLQGLVTANVGALGDGDARYGALLTPQGKVVETMFLTGHEGAVYIDVPEGRGPGLLRKLTLYRLRAKVEIEDVSDDVTVGASPAAAVPEGSFVSVPDPRHAEMGMRWLAPATGETDTETAPFLAHQAALGISDMGAGFEEAEVFPLDVNLDALNGIDHKKGCFVGQEVASRMFRKGEIRKRTYIVLGHGLKAGTELSQGERKVGEIRYALDDVALAIVRLDRLDPGTDGADADGQPITVIRPEYLS